MNSTHMHCSQLTKSTIAGGKKKKKKKRKTGKRGEENVDVQTKRSLNVFPSCFFYHQKKKKMKKTKGTKKKKKNVYIYILGLFIFHLKSGGKCF